MFLIFSSLENHGSKVKLPARDERTTKGQNKNFQSRALPLHGATQTLLWGKGKETSQATRDQVRRQRGGLEGRNLGLTELPQEVEQPRSVTEEASVWGEAATDRQQSPVKERHRKGEKRRRSKMLYVQSQNDHDSEKRQSY